MIRTVSLQTAKALKDAGFRQDTHFRHVAFFNTISVWAQKGSIEGIEPSYWEIHCVNARIKPRVWIAAPTSDELLEEMPKVLNGFEFRIIGSDKNTYDVGYWELGYEDERRFMHYEHKELVQALAYLWMHLKKEGLI